MKEELLEALFEYIDRAIDSKIEDAFGRDGLHESIMKSKSKEDLKRIAFTLDAAARR